MSGVSCSGGMHMSGESLYIQSFSGVSNWEIPTVCAQAVCCGGMLWFEHQLGVLEVLQQAQTASAAPSLELQSFVVIASHSMAGCLGNTAVAVKSCVACAYRPCTSAPRPLPPLPCSLPLAVRSIVWPLASLAQAAWVRVMCGWIWYAYCVQLIRLLTSKIQPSNGSPYR